MKTSFFKNLRSDRGYTLLFAVIVSSLVLAVGISILNISRKEFLIATSTRDSTAAFYAADGALECALFNEEQSPTIFDTSVDRTSSFVCNIPHNAIDRNVNGSHGTFTFHSKMGGEGGSCAVVTVIKETVNVNGVNKDRTRIESRGYNTGWDDTTSTCSLASAKRVERAVRYITY